LGYGAFHDAARKMKLIRFAFSGAVVACMYSFTCI